jgi:DNA-binding NarL/FixJ family response regulator
VHPQVLILDGTGLAHHGIAMLAAWYGDMPELKTLLVCDIGDADMEEFIGHALCYGARGFISTACALEAYAKAIRVIVADDIWIGRKTLARVMIHFIRKWQKRPEAVTEHWLQEHQAVDHPGALNQALESLTEREWQIIHLVAQGDTNKEIARQIEISDKTVKTHLRNIYHKLNIKRRMQLLLLEDWFHRC